MNFFTVWFEDNIGISSISVYKNTKEKAIEYFNTYYRGCNIVGISNN